MRSILALDVSSRACGWAFGRPQDTPSSGVIRFARDGDIADEVWVRALKWTNDQVAVMRPDIVAIEAPILSTSGGFTNPNTQSMLWGLQAVIRTVVKARMPGRAELVNVAAARKAFTGRGGYAAGEAKQAVQREAIRRGWLSDETLDPDRADALAVWCAVAIQQRPDLTFSRKRAA